MEIKSNKLTQKECEVLNDWLNAPGSVIFLRVLQSRMFKHEVGAANHLIHCTANGDAVANKDALEAAKIKAIVALVASMRGEKEFVTHSSVPSNL